MSIIVMYIPFFILLGLLAWAVFWDSKKKRPDVPWYWRYIYIITFKKMRDW